MSLGDCVRQQWTNSKHYSFGFSDHGFQTVNMELLINLRHQSTVKLL